MMLQTPTLRTRQQYCSTHSLKIKFSDFDWMQGCVPFQNCLTSNKDADWSKLYTLCATTHSLYANVKRKMCVGCIAHNINLPYFPAGLMPFWP